MKKGGWIGLAVALAMLGLNFTYQPAQSARGTPDSPDFGYGVVADLDGANPLDAIQSAAQISVDWLAVTLDWGRHWPDPTLQPDLASFDQAMTLAGQYRLSVLVKLTGAPAWAKTSGGPDPERTAWFVTNLARRYPGVLKAIELFPGANTAAGWGGAPDPQAYLTLFNDTRAALQQAHLDQPVLLVAAGLTPLPLPNPSPADQDDLAFLQSLYRLGAAQTMEVISMTLPDVTGSPLKDPGSGEHRVLRHYEEIRQLMLANQDSQGILWLTGFHWPSGNISSEDSAVSADPGLQNQWLIQAFRQLRSQLYIGVAFFDSLNPPGTVRATQTGSFYLVSQASSDHPFFSSLMEIIAQNNREQTLPLSFDQPQSKHIVKERLNPP